MELIYSSDNFNEDQLQEIDRGIRFMLSVTRGTYPMDRYFGLPIELVDMHEVELEGDLREEIENLLEIYAPEMHLTSLEIKSNADGTEINPVIYLEEADEDEEEEGDEE